jgi:ribonuclease E
MPTKHMLIDASHPEETRVVVLDGNKVEEFDFEAASKRPLKGNIYLAKVTRVEPSLQAAFVEYGGNRQGFLAFSEIHPDYYQIPVADRMALLAEQEADARRRADEEFESVETGTAPASDAELSEEEESDSAGTPNEAASGNDTGDNHHSSDDDERDDAHEDEADHRREAAGQEESEEGEAGEQTDTQSDSTPEYSQPSAEEAGPAEYSAEMPESAEPQASGEAPSSTEQPSQSLRQQRPGQRWMRRRHYKIQEVIKRRQVILVQVVKEERGNKGAALTTYMSLAGRYCVLMPNTPRGGGISRKITNANDRKRLKSAAAALELPEGMGLIIRTAGESRTKLEIKRDYEYLLRMWDTIRETTLQSNAPACVYEEGDLIKRAIRDLYNKDVTDVVVEGDDGYRNAKDFMRMLMPSHAKNVKPYKEPVPLFQRHHIEAQLDSMFQPTVTLKSGGYIVINQTEALVSIDVNSGRATREHNIEDTARKTNLEAADEIGRQLRLRDLAGLIVIDFIDMEDQRNDREVEKRIRDAVKNDRARVQIGKISQFGLLEMSRQRLRAGVVAGSTVPCPHCGGQGIVRSVESTALRVLRGLEEEGQKLKASAVTVRVASDVAIYTLNQKRRELARIESDYSMAISFEPKEMVAVGTFEIERTAHHAPDERPKLAATIESGLAAPVSEEPEADEDSQIEEVEVEEESEEERSEERPQAAQPSGDAPQGEGGGRRKRRRRRRGGRDRERGPHDGAQPQPQIARPERVDFPVSDVPDTTPGAYERPVEARSEFQHANGNPQQGAVPRDGVPGENGGHRKRRRRRRRGRGGRPDGMPGAETANGLEGVRVGPSAQESQADNSHEAQHHEGGIKVLVPSGVTATPNAESAPVWSLTPERPRERAESRASERAAVPEPVAPVSVPQAPAAPPRKGWWQRTFKTD